LTNDGRLFGCGKNKHGVLGVGDSRMRYKLTPITNTFGNNVKIVSADFHDNTAICLSSDGSVFTWGKNSNCIQEDFANKFVDSSVPVQVQFLSGVKIVEIGVSDSHFYAVTCDRVNLLTWGKC
jgi:alpha-tubulin suppressor-like RCC1 family protein